MLRSFSKLFGAPLLGVVVALGGISACQAEPAAELTEQQAAALKERVQDRWSTLAAKDFGKTWEFSTPTYRRIFPKELFVHNFSYSVNWELTGVEVTNYDADAAVASVATRVMSEPAKHTSAASKAIGAVPVTVREKWVFADGEWWHGANE